MIAIVFKTVDLVVIIISPIVITYTIVNIDKLELAIDKAVYDINEYDLPQLTKTFSFTMIIWQVKAKDI